MRHTRGFSVIHLLIIVTLVLLLTWGASKLVYEQELQGPQGKTQSYGSLWDTVRTITWTSYADKEFRFALRFPSNWTLKKEEGERGFPLWSIGRPSEMGARVSVRQGKPRCARSNAFTLVAFGEKVLPVCVLEEGENLWYVTQFSRGEELFELSCSYATGLKNCYNFFFSFNFIP